MRHIEKRYLRELIPATLGYVVVLFISIGWLRWYGAGLPLIATLLGGLALGAVLGIAGGVLVAAALLAGAVLVFRGRRRRSLGVAQ